MAFSVKEMPCGAIRRLLQCENKYIGEEIISRRNRLNLVMRSRLADVLDVAIRSRKAGYAAFALKMPQEVGSRRIQPDGGIFIYRVPRMINHEHWHDDGDVLCDCAQGTTPEH